MVPRTLGPYEVRQTFGEIGLGTAYLGAHVATRQPCTLVQLSPRLAADRAFVQRLRDAAAGPPLAHPHIVDAHGLEELDGTLVLVAEELDGRTLRDLLRDDGPLPIDRALRLLRHLSAALDAAHTRGVFGWATTPPNVVVTPDGDALLADLGFGRAASIALAPHGGSVSGQTGRLAVDGDLRIFGILAQTVLSRQTRESVNGPDASPTSLRASDAWNVQAALTLLTRLQAGDPDTRFTTVSALADRLERELRSAGASVTTAWTIGQPDATSYQPVVAEPASEARPTTLPRSDAHTQIALTAWRTPPSEPPPHDGYAPMPTQVSDPAFARAARSPLPATGESSETDRLAFLPVEPRPAVSTLTWAIVGASLTLMLAVIGFVALVQVSHPAPPPEPAVDLTPTLDVGRASVLSPPQIIVVSGSPSVDAPTAASGPPASAADSPTAVPPAPTETAPARAEREAPERLKQAGALIEGATPDPAQALAILDDLDRSLPPESAQRQGIPELRYRALIMQAQRQLQASLASLDLGQIQQARDLFAKALEIRPNDEAATRGQQDVQLAEARVQYERIYGTGSLDDRLRLLEQIYAARPEYDGAQWLVRDKLYAELLNRADQQWAAGERDGARAALERARQVRPDGPEVVQREASWFPTPTPTPRPAPVQPAPQPKPQPVQPAPRPQPGAPTGAPARPTAPQPAQPRPVRIPGQPV